MNQTQTLQMAILNSEPQIDSRIIAKGLGITHKSFMETLRTYQSELRELGSLVPFETEAVKTANSRGTKYVRYVMLNENQVIFATQLSRNTPEVVAFKLAITKAFSEARDILLTLTYAPQADLEGLTPRQIRLVGIVGHMADNLEKGESWRYLIQHFTKELELATPEERAWKTHIHAPSVKLLT